MIVILIYRCGGSIGFDEYHRTDFPFTPWNTVVRQRT